jgi:hypothetical protein
VCILSLLLVTTDPAIALPLLPLPESSVPAHWGVRLVVARGGLCVSSMHVPIPPPGEVGLAGR